MKPEDVTTHNLGELLSELLARVDRNNPWEPRLPLSERRADVQRLAKMLGPRYNNATLESYEVYDMPKQGDDRLTQMAAVAKVRHFCENMPQQVTTGGGLVFFGRAGTGKDHLMAAAMYYAILRHGFSVEWHDGITVAQRIRARIDSGPTEHSFIETYVRPQILAISDPIPPRGDASPFVVDTLQRIIDKRYRRGLSTWATINVRDGREAEERLAAPIVDRLRHGSLCLQCGWDSYRKREKLKPAE